jgi:hypothetical protein
MSATTASSRGAQFTAPKFENTASKVSPRSSAPSRSIGTQRN